jgi:hypothetical protein
VESHIDSSCNIRESSGRNRIGTKSSRQDGGFAATNIVVFFKKKPTSSTDGRCGGTISDTA